MRCFEGNNCQYSQTDYMTTILPSQHVICYEGAVRQSSLRGNKLSEALKECQRLKMSENEMASNLKYCQLQHPVEGNSRSINIKLTLQLTLQLTYK